MKNNCHRGWKTLWEKEKLLVTSNFSFSHNVFHSYISLVWKNAPLCGNGLHFPKRPILDSSKLKKYAYENSKFDENGRKFSKWEEKAVGKGEIACYEHFLLFSQCFQKSCTTDMWKPGLVWERVKMSSVKINVIIYYTFWPCRKELLPTG